MVFHRDNDLKKLLLVFGLITTGGMIALLSFFMITVKDSAPSTQTSTTPHSQDITSQHQDSLLRPSLKNETAHLINPSERYRNLSDDKSIHPSIKESYSTEQVHEILFVVDIMDKMIETGILSLEDLVSYTKAKGFVPYLEREGHIKTGFRQIVKINKLKDKSSMIREFHGAYYEHDKEFVFDRFYYGLEKKQGLYEQLVMELDQRIDQSHSRKLIQKSRSRWDFKDGSFIFIHAEYKKDRDSDEPMILIGKEWEIH